MSVKAQILSLREKLNAGKPTSLLVDVMAANIDDYAVESTFYDLPFDVICLILSKVTTTIRYSLANEILSNSASKFGKQAVTLLQYLDCETIGAEYATNLIKNLVECPIIR